MYNTPTSRSLVLVPLASTKRQENNNTSSLSTWIQPKTIGTIGLIGLGAAAMMLYSSSSSTPPTPPTSSHSTPSPAPRTLSSSQTTTSSTPTSFIQHRQQPQRDPSPIVTITPSSASNSSSSSSSSSVLVAPLLPMIDTRTYALYHMESLKNIQNPGRAAESFMTRYGPWMIQFENGNESNHVALFSTREKCYLIIEEDEEDTSNSDSCPLRRQRVLLESRYSSRWTSTKTPNHPFVWTLKLIQATPFLDFECVSRFSGGSDTKENKREEQHSTTQQHHDECLLLLTSSLSTIGVSPSFRTTQPSRTETQVFRCILCEHHNAPMRK